MISRLSGAIKDIEINLVTLFVNGIGFQIFVPDEKLYNEDQIVDLYIHSYFHQDNGTQLFGFNNQAEKNVFQMIISCSGIGPKLGLAILASMSPDQFLQAILLADIKLLSSINGLGQKKVESMILQLKDKVSKMKLVISSDGSNLLVVVQQVSEALSSLNYKKSEISLAVDHIKKDSSIENISFDIFLRKALAFLAKRIN